MSSEAKIGNRQDQLFVAISGMLGMDIAKFALIDTERLIQQKLHGNSRDLALAYFSQLSQLQESDTSHDNTIEV